MRKVFRFLPVPSFRPHDTSDSCWGLRNVGSQGDSGGPLIQYDASGEPVLVGITSFGRQCALPSYPGVYVRVAAYTEWLDRQGVEYNKINRTQAPTEKSFASRPLVRNTLIIVATCVSTLLFISVMIVFLIKQHGAMEQAANDTAVVDVVPPARRDRGQPSHYPA